MDKFYAQLDFPNNTAYKQSFAYRGFYTSYENAEKNKKCTQTLLS